MGMSTHKIKGEDYYQCRDVKAERDKLLEEVAEPLGRLEAAESDALEQARLNGMDSEREAALMAKLEAAEKSDAESIAMYRKARDERDAMRARIEAAEEERTIDEQRIADLLDELNRVGHENDAMRARIEAMERQEPFDADNDVFRSAFEAALKAGNWPATRQGDGYRSPTTQIAWRIAFSTVNRLKLYARPGAKGE